MGARGEVTALLAHAAIHARAVAVALARCETWREMTDECVVAIISVIRCFIQMFSKQENMNFLFAHC